MPSLQHRRKGKEPPGSSSQPLPYPGVQRGVSLRGVLQLALHHTPGHQQLGFGVRSIPLQKLLPRHGDEAQVALVGDHVLREAPLAQQQLPEGGRVAAPLVHPLQVLLRLPQPGLELAVIPQELLELLPQELHPLQPRLRPRQRRRVLVPELGQLRLQPLPLLPGQAVAVLVQESLCCLRGQDDVLLLGQQLLVLRLKDAGSGGEARD